MSKSQVFSRCNANYDHKNDGSLKFIREIRITIMAVEKYQHWSSRTYAQSCLKVTGYEFEMGKVNEF